MLTTRIPEFFLFVNAYNIFLCCIPVGVTVVFISCVCILEECFKQICCVSLRCQPNTVGCNIKCQIKSNKITILSFAAICQALINSIFCFWFPQPQKVHCIVHIINFYSANQFGRNWSYITYPKMIHMEESTRYVLLPSFLPPLLLPSSFPSCCFPSNTNQFLIILKIIYLHCSF